MAKTDDDFSLVVGEDGLARPAWAAADPMREYYDTEWGMPVRDERGVFERLSLEVFQAGLSWGTILRKREAFRAAFEGFDPDVVAAYGPDDVERLMADATIVRNHRKILATITNAQATVALREADDVVGGLAGLFWSFQPDVTPMPRTGAEVPSETAESAALAWRRWGSWTCTSWGATGAAAPGCGRGRVGAGRVDQAWLVNLA